MKKGLTKLLCAALTATMVISCVPCTDFGFVAPQRVEAAADNYISASGGWFESAYAEWSTVPEATGFAAYVKGAGEADTAYVQLDDELIRKYPTYFRADAVGLKAGQYVIKVVPYINGTLDESKAFTTGTLDVQAYDRSGFAFSSNSPFKTGSGAYNDDGTLRSGAKVFYVTKDTAKTITADVVTDSKGTTTTYTGMQAIITAKQKGYDTTPFDFRIIGTINADDMDGFDSSAEGLQIKGKNSYSELNITIEGIGEDATIKGFGMLLRNAGNVELRNFANMLCMDDCISIDTDNCNLWIHNIDLFYGSAGGASDQAKGDGTIDVKGDSQYVTISYNHLYDSGKSSLCGMTSESGPNYITYHHNWFDHSDSRHPRIRTMSVHVYNNYYDGNSKYGIGAAQNSSAFVESNYFANCKHPMLSSLQGSDIMANEKTGAPDFSADGTFSGENGGIIKAYNNHIEGSDKNELAGGVEPVYYNAADTQTNGAATQFDAYLASSRDEKVPSTVAALVGGTTYTNFDTDPSIDLGVSEADITPVEQVPAVVMASAGRMNGGDFFETTGTSRSDYTGLTDSTDYAVDTVLKQAITNYTSTLVSVGGKGVGGEVTSTESTTETTTTATDSTTQTTTKTTESTTETTTSSLIPLSAETYDAAAIIADSARFIVVDNQNATGQIKINESGSVSFAVNAGANVVINYKCGSSDAKKSSSISCAGKTSATLVGGSDPSTLELADLAAGEYKITAAQSGGTTSQIVSIVVTYNTTDDGLWGDADCSGVLTANDAAFILLYTLDPVSAGFSDTTVKYCDVDANGIITSNDAAMVLQKTLISETVFPAETK